MVEGDDDWQAPLAPPTLELVDVWDDGAWLDITPGASPRRGYDLPGSGPHRITATVGCGDCPAAVLEAVRGLAEYMAAVADIALGASSSSLNIG